MRRLSCFLIACSHSTPAPKPPDLSAITPMAITARGQLYADCLGDAVANKQVGYTDDPSTTLLLFTCRGDAAKKFWEGLAEWSAKLGTEQKANGATLRSTSRVKQNLFGVDYCTSDGAAYQCVVTLNVGSFARR